MARKFIDTNILLTDCSDISDTILSSKTIEELENIKASANKDAEIKYKARQAVRAIKEQKPEILQPLHLSFFHLTPTHKSVDIIEKKCNKAYHH